VTADSRLIVPPFDGQPWPTLGPEVCDFIEANLVHGPGDVLGDPVTLTDEEILFLYRVYEVFPKGHRRAGRRRFKTATYSRRKGTRKTEFAAWIAITESHPEAPVRCDGWRLEGDELIPVGRPVRDPYIPMLAVTEEQTEDLAYGAVYAILTEDSCPLVDEYDVTLERVKHRSAPGEIKALAAAPSARDGARTTFQHFDETHLFTSTRLVRAHTTMVGNIPKRKLADPWSLETTTMYGPGEGSIAESSHEAALEAIRHPGAQPNRLFDHRQASEKHDLTTKRGLRAAVVEASGDAIEWADIDSIMALHADPKWSEARHRRYWLNQPRRTRDQWFKPGVFETSARKRSTWPKDGTRIVLGFDGSYNRDSTALMGCTVAKKRFVFTVKVWEKPADAKDWRAPRNEVVDEIDAAMGRWDVAEFAPDPAGWHREIEDLEDTYGDETIVRFEWNQWKRSAAACDDFFQAFADDTPTSTHDGSEVLRRHVGNAVPVLRRGYTVITKSADDSPDKIDAAVAAAIAHNRAGWHLLNAVEDIDPLANIW
jgi:hypothetical protein